MLTESAVPNLWIATIGKYIGWKVLRTETPLSSKIKVMEWQQKYIVIGGS